MRTAFVQFRYQSRWNAVELSFKCRYEAESTGQLCDVEAELVAIGDDQRKPTEREAEEFRFHGEVWHQFLAALEEADADEYPVPDRDDVVNFGKDRY